jgi:flagellar motor protein MotB/predicted Ser/Thr protein kinase
LVTASAFVQLIGGYAVERLIGEGGAGAVYLARDEELGRSVAVKVLHPHNAKDPVRRKRFLREGRLMALIDSPHVVKVYSVGEDEGVPFLVMEYLQGEDLADRVRRAGPLPIDEALSYIRDAAHALMAADAAGITHRDVKPANLVVTDGYAKLTDFGLAVAADQSTDLTMEGLIAGTAAFMAPERVRGKSDRRSDIYSLGATLFAVLAARPPFEGNDPLAHLSAHLQLVPPRLDRLRPNIPQGVADLVARMLAKDPSQRTQTYAELIAAIDGLRGEAPKRIIAEGAEGVRGSLRHMSVSEIVQTLELGRRDARIDIELGHGEPGVIGISQGHVVYAAAGRLVGIDAFCALAPCRDGRFLIRYETTEALGKNIELPTSGLLLEAMRRLDEDAAAMAIPEVSQLGDAPGTFRTDQAIAYEEATQRPAVVKTWRARMRERLDPRVSSRQAWLLLALTLVLGASLGLAFEERLLGTQAEAQRVHGLEMRVNEQAEGIERMRAEREALEATLATELARTQEIEALNASLLERDELEEAARAADGQLQREIAAKLRGTRMVARTTDEGVVIVIPSRVLFSTRATLSGNGERALGRVAEALQAAAGRPLRIEGHTDDVPIAKESSFPSNWELSGVRAFVVRRTLETAGLDATTMSAVARADTAPAASNARSSGRAKNRRMEIHVLRAATVTEGEGG